MEKWSRGVQYSWYSIIMSYDFLLSRVLSYYPWGSACCIGVAFRPVLFYVWLSCFCIIGRVFWYIIDSLCDSRFCKHGIPWYTKYYGPVINALLSLVTPRLFYVVLSSRDVFQNQQVTSPRDILCEGFCFCNAAYHFMLHSYPETCKSIFRVYNSRVDHSKMRKSVKKTVPCNRIFRGLEFIFILMQS